MERKFTDNEIVKALECCNKPAGKNNCELCPFYHSKGRCTENMLNNAIDLINRQKAEIERLREVHGMVPSVLEENWRLSERIRRLSKYETSAIEANRGLISEARAEAIKEFVEKIKKKAYITKPYAFLAPRGIEFKIVDVADIDTLVKEMTEEGTE